MKNPASAKSGRPAVADQINITIRERGTGRKLGMFDCPRPLFARIERDAKENGTTWGKRLESLLWDMPFAKKGAAA